MNVLAICSGIGGLELGVKLAYPTARTVCYVEGEAFPAAILVQRMADGHLDSAPIWSDVRTFNGEPWRGVVDLVTAGFPCQPFSLAGKRQRERDPRHLWPDIFRIVRECEPSLVFLENVQVRAYLEPFRDLRNMGFTVSDPFACTAAELGAGHLRRRVFVLAYHSGALIRQEPPARTGPVRGHDAGISADDFGSGLEIRSGERSNSREERQATQRSYGTFIAVAESEQMGAGRFTRESAERVSSNAAVLAEREPRDEAMSEFSGRDARPEALGAGWWSREPALERMVHGVPHRVDRDRALGNAVVPIVAAFAFANLVRNAFTQK